MNSPATGLKIAGIIFALFGLVHVWRLIKGFDVVVGSHHIPLWTSGVAIIVAGLLFAWMFKLACRLKHPA